VTKDKNVLRISSFSEQTVKEREQTKILKGAKNDWKKNLIQ
jgi:hypothetical protein